MRQRVEGRATVDSWEEVDCCEMAPFARERRAVTHVEVFFWVIFCVLGGS